MYVALLQRAAEKDHDTSSLRLCVSVRLGSPTFFAWDNRQAPQPDDGGTRVEAFRSGGGALVGHDWSCRAWDGRSGRDPVNITPGEGGARVRGSTTVGRVNEYTTSRRLAAEFLGTFWLVLAGCGSAVLAAGFVSESDGFASGIGFAGVSLAFGLSVVTMAYAVGHVSGGHFNPAVTVGLAAAGRFAWREVAPYVVTQVVAAVGAAAVLLVIASGQDGFSAVDSGFATNGYGDRSPGGTPCSPCWSWRWC